MKYLIYARISPRGSDFDHNAENSTDMQIDYCKKYIQEKGGMVAGIVKDEFLSGKNLKRPGIQSVMDELENGAGQWDCFCVYNLSRLTRSPQDMYDFMGILSRHNKKFLSIREPEFDFSTMQGELMMGIITHINQYMRKQLAANVRDKMMAIAAKGLWPAGHPPYGYKRGEKKDNHLYVDPEKALIVRDIFKMYADANTSTRAIHSKYKKILAHSKIHYILHDPVYVGKIKYGGQIFQGQHESLISETLFRKVQDLLPQPTTSARPKSYSYPFLLTGMIHCHCGRKLTPGTAKSGQYAYYTCTDIDCRKRLSAPFVEEQVLTKLRNCPLNEKIIRAAIAEVQKRNEEEYTKKQPQLTEYKLLQKKLISEKELLVDKIISTTNLSPVLIESLNQRTLIIEEKLGTLQSQIDALESLHIENEAYLEAGLEFLKRVQKLSDILEKEHDANRLRTIIPLFISEIRLMENGTCQIFMREPESSTKCSKWCAHKDSNLGPND